MGPVLPTIFFPSHWLHSHMTILEIMDSGERGMNPVAMTTCPRTSLRHESVDCWNKQAHNSERLRLLTMVSTVELNIDRIHLGLTKVTSFSFSS